MEVTLRGCRACALVVFLTLTITGCAGRGAGGVRAPDIKDPAPPMLMCARAPEADVVPQAPPAPRVTHVTQTRVPNINVALPAASRDIHGARGGASGRPLVASVARSAPSRPPNLLPDTGVSELGRARKRVPSSVRVPPHSHEGERAAGPPAARHHKGDTCFASRPACSRG